MSIEVTVCFTRQTTHPDDTRFIYIKQDTDTGEYQIKYKTENNKATLYRKTMFLVDALSCMALLMAEYGMGCKWNKL